MPDRVASSSGTGHDAATAQEWDEWIGLHATRNEVAENYATGLRVHGMDWDGWAHVNAAILRRCVVEARGRMRTVLVRFLDTGERVTTSARAVRDAR